MRVGGGLQGRGRPHGQGAASRMGGGLEDWGDLKVVLSKSDHHFPSIFSELNPRSDESVHSESDRTRVRRL